MFTENSVQSTRILYTPSYFAKNALIYLQEVGSLNALKPHISARSDLHSYLFFFVIEGEGELIYCGTKKKLTAGDCVFIDCSRSYSHRTSTKLWKLKWVHFNGESMKKIYEKYEERGGEAIFRPTTVQPFEELCDSIYNVASSNDPVRDMRINELLACTLTRIMEMSRHTEAYSEIKRGTNHSFSIRDVKEYLDKNSAKKIVLDDLAKYFYINKFYLTRLFKNQYGISIINYLINLRITQAKNDLRFTNNSIETIAFDCGFDDANYFSRTFKKIEGMSPLRYRKNWIQ